MADNQSLDDSSPTGLLGSALNAAPLNLSGASSSYRNNNPGNLVYGQFAQSHGAVGKDQAGKAIFPDLATGTQAQQALWSGPYGNKPIGPSLAKWIGPDRNYLASLGVDPSATFNQLTPAQQQALMLRQRQMEGYYAPGAQGQTPVNAAPWPTPLPPGTRLPQVGPPPTDIATNAPLPPSRPAQLPLDTVPVAGDPFAHYAAGGWADFTPEALAGVPETFGEPLSPKAQGIANRLFPSATWPDVNVRSIAPNLPEVGGPAGYQDTSPKPWIGPMRRPADPTGPFTPGGTPPSVIGVPGFYGTHAVADAIANSRLPEAQRNPNVPTYAQWMNAYNELEPYYQRYGQLPPQEGAGAYMGTPSLPQTPQTEAEANAMKQRQAIASPWDEGGPPASTVWPTPSAQMGY